MDSQSINFFFFWNVSKYYRSKVTKLEKTSELLFRNLWTSYLDKRMLSLYYQIHDIARVHIYCFFGYYQI